jgi:predicted nucleic acid-binding protein
LISSLIVLDASVAAKWCVLAGEPFEQQAIELLARQQRGEVQFIVPDLFWAEMGNILWKAARKDRCTPEQAVKSIQLIRAQDLSTFSCTVLLEQSLAIAQKYGRTFYDSIYLALAVKSKATLITADERLANATAAYLPVKWLGAIG